MKLKDMTVTVKAGPGDGLADGQFTAYASVFNNKDSYGDIVQPGAFTDTLAAWKSSGNPIPLLYAHDTIDPFSNIGAIVDATEDEHGLLFTAQLDTENPKAAQTYKLLKGKRINNLSYAYDTLDGEDSPDGYLLKKLKLFEISVVQMGANDQTEVLAVKAAADVLTRSLKAGRVLSAANETMLSDCHDQIMAAAMQIKTVLASVVTDAGKGHDPEQASGTGPANDEGTHGVKSEEPNRNPSVDDWSRELTLIDLETTS